VKHPQVLIYESDGRLAEMLRNLAKERRWALREPRRPEACLTLLQDGGPAVLVLRVGGDLGRQMTLLERVAWLCPETATVVMSDEANETLAGLAWDLGASYVLFPPQSRDRLPALVAELMGVPPSRRGEKRGEPAMEDA
jgi:DNA-binding NtrC family response regulator